MWDTKRLVQVQVRYIRTELTGLGQSHESVEVCPVDVHTAECLLGEWDKPYSRELAAYPTPSLRSTKYWPTVRRIDGAYGDRNLVCACPEPEAFAE